MVTAAGFLSRYLIGPLPHVRCRITVNKNVSVSLNKTLPPFLSVIEVKGIVCNLSKLVYLFDVCVSINPKNTPKLRPETCKTASVLK